MPDMFVEVRIAGKLDEDHGVGPVQVLAYRGIDPAQHQFEHRKIQNLKAVLSMIQQFAKARAACSCSSRPPLSFCHGAQEGVIVIE